MIAHFFSLLLILLILAIPVALIMLIIEIIHTYISPYEAFKDYIYSKDVECDKLSFLQFLLLFEKYNAKFDNNESYIYYSQPCYEVFGHIVLKPYAAMLGCQKFVYFNFPNYLVYYNWLKILTKREYKKRNFTSKRKNGLFKESGDE